MVFPIATDDEIRIVKNMRREDTDELKRYILQADPSDIFVAAENKEPKPDKRYIICPFCGNGSGKDKTPVDVAFKGDRWIYHCFACDDLNGDLLSIIAHENHLSLSNRDDMIHALAVGANLIGYSLQINDFKDESRRPRKNQDKNANLLIFPRKLRGKKSPKTYTSDVANATSVELLTNSPTPKEIAPETFAPFTRLEESRNNLPTFFRANKTFRGLTLETLTRLKWGFLKDYSHPSDKERKRLFSAIIIPNDKGGVLARAIGGDFKSNVKPTAPTTINPPTDNNLLFVVEGAIDAASIAQATSFKFGVIALGGLSGIDSFLNYITELYHADKPKPKIIVMLDNDSDVPEDNRGQIGAKKLLAELLKRGFVAINRVITNQPRIDANLLLTQNGNDFVLANAISTIVRESDDDFADALNTVAALKFNDTPSKESASVPAQIESSSKSIAAETQTELADAFKWFDALTVDNFSADDTDKLRFVALIKAFNDSKAAEKFLAIVKAAKNNAQNKLAESKSDLIADINDTEKLSLLAISEGINIKALRRDLDRELSDVRRDNKKRLQEEEYKAATERNRARREQKAAQFQSDKERLEELKKMPPSPERDSEIMSIIRDLCEWSRDREGNPVAIKATQANANLIFEHDPNLDGLIGYDEFHQADILKKAPVWRPIAKVGDEWTDKDDAELRGYIRSHYKELSNRDLIYDTVTIFSNKHSFHEVKDFFHNLPTWDGKPRAETLFIDWLKIEDSAFAREVTLKWLLGAVARIFQPGCTFQWALVLRGNQKIGKGFIPERLGGKWYIAIGDRVDDSHAVDTIKNCWIGEFKEMTGMRKADVNAIKAFIELPSDTRRFAYGRRATTVQRHCVFCITVNDDAFLADMTGNRRFLILDSPLPKFGYVKEVRGESLKDDNVIAQIWAEVFHIYNELFKDGFDVGKLELTPETEFKGEEIANQYLRDDGVIGIVSDFLNLPILPDVIWHLLTKEERRKFFTDGSFTIDQDDLIYRFKNFAGLRAASLREQFDDACLPCSSVRKVYHKNKDGGESWHYVFYGWVPRRHICAAEILAECFDKGDKRISSIKANEILGKIDGWREGKILQKVDPHYSFQRRVFYRDIDK